MQPADALDVAYDEGVFDPHSISIMNESIYLRNSASSLMRLVFRFSLWNTSGTVVIGAKTMLSPFHLPGTST